jgi:hypothetical protein
MKIYEFVSSKEHRYFIIPYFSALMGGKNKNLILLKPMDKV